MAKDVKSVLIEEESIVKKKDREFQTMKKTGRIVFILRMPWRKNFQKEINYVDSLFP